jgi:hypothetical protein
MAKVTHYERQPKSGAVCIGTPARWTAKVTNLPALVTCCKCQTWQAKHAGQ